MQLDTQWTLKGFGIARFDLDGNTEMCKIYDDTRWLKGRALIRPNQEITFTFADLLPAASPAFPVRNNKE